MRFIFFDKVAGWVSATLPKMYSLASTFQGFVSICCYLSKFRDILGKFISQENRFVATNRCEDFKIFIPAKTIYSVLHIIVWENLRRLAFGVGLDKR